MNNFRKIWAAFIVLALLILGVKGYMINNAKSNGRSVYSITVHNFSGDETYMTSEYKKDSANGCITFTDAFGLKNTICGNYSIKEW